VKTLTLHLPDNIELDNREAAMLLATKLYEQGKLSLGQAAELAGYSKRAFMELLGNYNVSLFNYNEQDLENDIRNADNHHI
jgi:predicted HTH domain antitoxin